MPFLLPNQQCQSIEGKNITFHGLAYPTFPKNITKKNVTFKLTDINNNSNQIPLKEKPRLTRSLASELLVLSTFSSSTFLTAEKRYNTSEYTDQ